MTKSRVRIEYIIDKEAMKQEAIEALELELDHLSKPDGWFVNTDMQKLADFLLKYFPSKVNRNETVIQNAMDIMLDMLDDARSGE